MKGKTAMEVAGSTRFGLFAVSQVIWSLGCSFFVMRLLGGGVQMACAAAVGMMLGYLLLGWVVARLAHWPRAGRRESLWAVLLPAVIAWIWAGCTAFFLYGMTDALAVAAALGLPAILLASPSLLFVAAWIATVGGRLGSWNATLGSAIFLAGLLPSLLFWMGSVLGGAKAKQVEQSPGAE